jgi:phage-related minor tail protein
MALNSAIKGITINIGGNTTQLQKALKEVDTQTRSTAKELKDVERLLKFDPKNTELLAQKQKLLGDQVLSVKNKLDTLKEAQKQVQIQFEKGEVSEEQYRYLRKEIANTEIYLKNLETQLKSTNDKWGDFATKAKDVGEKAVDVGKKMTVGITTPIVGAGAVAFKFASDIEDAFGATEQIFKKSADEVKKWADELETYYGISEGSALEYANTMGAMLQNIGKLSEKEASKQSQTLVELAGDLTAMFGGTTESAVQALTGALKGNNSMLDNYGMGVNEATIKTKALEMGLTRNGKQLDLAGKQAATLALIMEQTADAQGQAAREADGASGSMRTLTTELKNVAGELGAVLLPIITPFIANLKDMVKSFGSLSPETQKTIVVIAGLAAVMGPLLAIFGNISIAISLLIKGFGLLKIAKLIDMADTITLTALYAKDAIAKGLSTASTVAMTVATTAWNIVAGIATTVTTALGVAVAFLTSPIGLVVLAITALIAIGVLLYKNWDTIKAKTDQIWGAIAAKFTEIGNNIKLTLTNLIEFIKNNWQEIMQFMVNPISGGIKLLYKLNPDFKKWVDSIIETIKNWWKDVKAWWADKIAAAKKAGANFLQSIWDGAKSKWNDFKKWISDIAEYWKEKLGFATSNQNVSLSTTNRVSTVFDGSHANGLANVPFDNYKAILHKNERVLTAQENKNYSNNNDVVSAVGELRATVESFKQQLHTQNWQNQSLQRM